jgi:hypothetical protein
LDGALVYAWLAELHFDDEPLRLGTIALLRTVEPSGFRPRIMGSMPVLLP